MAASSKVVYVCKECGYETAKWMGKCPGCNSWGTLEEDVRLAKKGGQVSFAPVRTASAKALSQIDITTEERFITGITGKKNFSVVYMAKRGMSGEVGVLRKLLSIFERHNVIVDYTPNGIDNVSLVVHSDALSNKLYAVLSEVQQELQPDKLQVVDGIAMVAIVGRHMASQPGSSGKIFSALGQAGVNIRMINQGPDELNIIIGIDNRDFAEAIRVLYNSFVK